MGEVGAMDNSERIAEAIRRSLRMLPAELAREVAGMFTPEALAIASGTFLAWTGSHLFGIGEIVDLILLAVGFTLLGTSVFAGARELYTFATTAMAARTEHDLDAAASHFASAVGLLGVSTVSAVLLRGSARAAIARGRPQIRPVPYVGTLPPTGTRPTVTRPFSLPGGQLGQTDMWGNISVIRNQTITDQRLTLYHEWVHRILSPRVAPLRQLRAQAKASAYLQSALLRYIEEALAETYSQIKVNGLRGAIVGIRFPLNAGYVTVSQLVTDGIALGNIVVGGLVFSVRMTQGPLPASHR
jgi:hypothetical protein